MSKPKVSPIQTRTAVVEIVPGASEGAGVTFRAALSSTSPVKRIFGTEILRHTDDAVDMSRAGAGLPLTVNHSERDPSSQSLPVGRVQGVRLDGDRLRGELHFDSDARAQEVKGKVERGVAPDISITYQVHDFEGPSEDGTVEVTRWMPMAASIVTMPADATVGVGRSHEEADMPEENPTGAGEASILDKVRARSSAGYQAGQEAATVRLNDLDAAATLLRNANPGLSGDVDALVAEYRGDPSLTIEQFRAHGLELLGTGAQPLSAEPSAARRAAPQAPGDIRRGMVVAGADNVDKVARGIEFALMERSGTKVDAEAVKGNQFRGWSIIDCARELLEAGGTSTRGWNSEQIAKASIQGRAISPGTANYVTADFPAVTENVITKRVQDAYAEADVTWNQWCSTFEVPDFKQFTIPRISNVLSLPVVAENAAYTDLTQLDAKESATLVKRGGLMSFSWEAMVNDDHSMFSRTADRMGNSAARTVDEEVYALLVLNKGVGPVAGPVMGDTNQLFDATNHDNAGTAALDLAGIVATRTAIARQTDDNSILLGIRLRHILVPEELRDTADNLAGSEYLPWTESSPGAQRVNTVRSTFTVISTVRLTDVNDWYGLSAAGGTMEVAFLNGNRSPMLERDQGWDTDAMHFKIRHPFIPYPVDWRGMYWNEVT